MNYGLVAILNNRQLDERRAAEQAALAPADPYAGIVTRLSSHLTTLWQSARDAKSEVEQQMLRNLRQREGEYDPEKLTEIRKQGGSEVYMGITNLKCRALESWLLDLLFPPGERPYYCGPTTVPDLSGDIVQTIVQMTVMEAQQAIAAGIYISEKEVYERARARRDETASRIKAEAEARASRTEDAIDDLFIEGAWYDAMHDMNGDLVTHQAGLIKGPVVRKQRRLQWRQDGQGQWQPMATDELVPVWYSPSVFDIYPGPDSTGPQDGYLFELIRLRHQSLHSMIGIPGWKEDAIRAVLDEYAHGWRISQPIDQQRNELEEKRHWQNAPDAGLDMLEFHGAIQGSLLIEWGMDAAEIPDPQSFYEVTAGMIGRHVVRCVLNEDPMRRRPYGIAYLDRVKGAFWGKGLPQLIRDVQDVCNAAARALVNNLAISSGPLGEVEVDRLAEGEDATQIWPWRMIQTKSSKTTPAPAVRWHNVSSNANELLAVYQHFSQLADVYSGVQSFDHGVAARSGSAATASGLSMLINASSRQVKRVVRSIDRAIEHCVTSAHTYVMLYSDDAEAKGDVNIEARGSTQLLVREQQQMRRMEFLGLTNNPIDMAIIGPQGRAELLRESVKALDVPVDLVIPNRDELMARVRAEAMAAAQAAAGGQGADVSQGQPQDPGQRRLPVTAEQ